MVTMMDLQTTKSTRPYITRQIRYSLTDMNMGMASTIPLQSTRYFKDMDMGTMIRMIR
jgi:hypothetical protein